MTGYTEFVYELIDCNYCDGKIDNTNKKGRIYSRWFYHKLKSCRNCLAIRKAETYAKKREEKLKRQEFYKIIIPCGTLSHINTFTYKVGLRGFFYRKNVYDDGWTKVEIDKIDFCDGILLDD